MKKRLLVVEDDAHIRLGLCEALQAEGYDVVDCRDAKPGHCRQSRGNSD